MVFQGIQIGAVDLVALGIIVFFLILGLIKGFTAQVVRLLTYVVALALAKRYAGSPESGDHGGLSSLLVQWFPNQLENKTVAVYVAFFLIFVGVVILGALVSYLLRALLKRLALRSHDHLLGAVFGAMTGVVVVVVIISCMVFVSPESPLMNRVSRSRAFRLSGELIRVSQPFFPLEIRQEITKLLKRFPEAPPKE